MSFGKNSIRLQHVDSTNTYALNLLSNSKPVLEGTVIMAENQSSGRGQLGKNWESESGKNLTASYILYPSFLELSRQFMLSKVVSLSIVDVLKEIIPQPNRLKIKWPNDIYYQKEKLGGILIENVLSGNAWKAAVVGIGLNVNQQSFTQGVSNAISIKMICGESYTIEDVVDRLSEKLQKRYEMLKNLKYAEIDNDYHELLFRLEEYASFHTSKGIVNGTITGVSADGRLQILLNQSVEEYDLHEVSFLI